MQCICIIMTILDSSSPMFTTSIQVYNTISTKEQVAHTMLHSSSRVAGPAERPGIHKVHGAPVRSSSTRVSPGEVVVVPMGAVAASVPIVERNGPRISSPNHRQPSQDWGDGQNVDDLFSRQGFIYQLGAALGDPRLCQGRTDSTQLEFIMTYYYILLYIIAYPRGPA